VDGPILFKKLPEFISIIPSRYSKKSTQARWDEFAMCPAEEAKKLTALIVQHSSSPLGFCHNDLLLENVVYNEKEDGVSFIDYEYGGNNHIMFDIANHFNEYAGMDIPLDFTNCPDDEYIKEWLVDYMAAYRPKAILSEDLLLDLCQEVRMFSLASHLIWGLWGLVQAEHSLIDYDFMAFALARLSAFRRAWAEPHFINPLEKRRALFC